VRYLSAILFLGAGGFVLWFNATHTSRVLLFPFLERILPTLEADVVAQGQLTGILFLVVGGVLLGWNTIQHLRERRPPSLPRGG